MAPITQDTKFIDIFHSFFEGFNLARTKSLYLIVQALAAVSSINLVRVAAGMKTHVSKESNYRRLQHFIHEIRFDQRSLAAFLLRLAGLKPPYTLVLDRTNWEFGKAKINFLMLSALGDGWCIPVMWKLLPADGNSGQQDRIDLMNQFLTLVGKGKIFNLLADREFIGKDWIDYLIEHEIPFDIRIRENMKVKYKNRITMVKRLFSRMPIGKIQTIRRMVMMGSNRVYLQGERIINSKTNRSEYLIVCTYCQPAGSIRRYAERWYIENMFKDLKSNGFQLKCTHITALDRLDTLMGILAIAYTWMIRIGKWVKKKKPKLFKPKKHKRPGKSIFRAGLEEFIHSIYTANTRRRMIWMKFLSCT